MPAITSLSISYVKNICDLTCKYTYLGIIEDIFLLFYDNFQRNYA